MIELEAMRRTFGAVDALAGVDLKIGQGEAVAIMGRSGSGKSTLLHLLGLLDQPTSGAYRLDGHDTAALSDRARSQLRVEQIGFVFQAFHLVPQLSVLANVMLPFTYHPNPPPDARDLAIHCLERVGLAHRLDHRPTQLSGGELQRCAIARALVTSPQLILADEPTGNLDSETEQQVLSFLKELNDEGITLVVVTHDEQVAKKCDRVITLADGRVQ